MTISVIGAGHVGGTLGSRWAGKGHAVVFGVNDPGSAKVQSLLAATGGKARAAGVREAAAQGDVVVLAVPWEAVPEVLDAAGNLAGKIVIDATNPVAMGPDLAKGLLVGHTTSAAEQVAARARGARVVKAFNTTGWQNMADPRYGSERATMFLCGDDALARRVVTGLGEDLGFEMIDAGPLTVARLLEPLAMLWIHLAAFQGFGTGFAFKLLRR